MENQEKAPSITLVPKLIPPDQITVDPTQPRQTFDPIKQSELEKSVRQYGILQSLTVRPNPNGGYLLISGERRHRAAIAVGLNELPCIIRDVTDEVAKEIQLIENIQREDVHLMEQARGFLQLVELSQMDPQEIATRIGKPVYFVRQHLKLNNLSVKWQILFAKDAIKMSIALQIATLPQELQEDLYKAKVNKGEEKKEKPNVYIDSHDISRYIGDLKSASFDLTDALIDPKAGACTACPFNTANSSLFPTDQENPKCNNRLCFKNKTDIHLNRQLDTAKNDPSVTLVYEGYSKPELASKLKKEGFEVLELGYGEDCREVKIPSKPSWEKALQYAKHNKISQTKLKAQFKEQEIRFEAETKKFEKDLASGKYRKAFMIESNSMNQAGRYLFIELIPKASGRIVKKEINVEDDTPQDVEDQIERIKERQPRLLELDQEKIQRRIVEAVKADKSMDAIPKNPTKSDPAIINFLLLEHASSLNDDELQKKIKKPGLWNPKNTAEYIKALNSISKVQQTYLIRQIVLNKYDTRLPRNNGGLIFRLMAESLNTIPIAEFEKDQNAIAERRKATVEKSIGVLNEIKKDIIAKSKKNPKKATKMHSSKKKAA